MKLNIYIYNSKNLALSNYLVTDRTSYLTKHSERVDYTDVPSLIIFYV